MTIPTVRAFYFKQKYNIQMPVNIHNMEHIIIYKPHDTRCIHIYICKNDTNAPLLNVLPSIHGRFYHNWLALQ